MDNPLSTVDAERESVMKDFKKVLNREAEGVRHVIERHVKQQMGLIKPTKDTEVQTDTYRKLKEDIIFRVRSEIEEE